MKIKLSKRWFADFLIVLFGLLILAVAIFTSWKIWLASADNYYLGGHLAVTYSAPTFETAGEVPTYRIHTGIVDNNGVSHDFLEVFSAQAIDSIVGGSTVVPPAYKLVYLAGNNSYTMAVVPLTNYDYIVIRDGKIIPAEVAKRDDDLGLVLLKIQQSNLPVVSWADFASLRLGARMILFGVDVSKEPTEAGGVPAALKFTNWGIIRAFSDKNFFVSLEKEISEASGAPIITTLGEVAGMVLVDKNGNLKVVASDVIKDFLGQ